MKIIVLDIETVPAAWYMGADEKAFAPLPAHQPVVFGALHVRLERGGLAEIEDLTAAGLPEDEEWERPALVELAKVLRPADYLVTFNGRGFDAPLLQLRALDLAVPWEFWPAKRHRFPSYKAALFHIDLMDQLSDYGAARGIGLDNLAKMCGLPGKPGMSGADIATLIQEEGQPGLERAADYCRHDLLITLRLFLRMQFIHGHTSSGDARAWIGKVDRWAAQAGLEVDGKPVLR